MYTLNLVGELNWGIGHMRSNFLLHLAGKMNRCKASHVRLRTYFSSQSKHRTHGCRDTILGWREGESSKSIWCFNFEMLYLKKIEIDA